MSGDIAALLLDAQEGDEVAFACLYEVTNPVLVRYLRVVADERGADLALTSWATLVRRLSACPPDDQAWLEQVVTAGRTTADDAKRRAEWVDPGTRPPLVLADLENWPNPAPTAPTGDPLTQLAAELGPVLDPEPAPTPSGPGDAIDHAVDTLREVPPEEAEVLALHGIVGLSEEAIGRVTGLPLKLVTTVIDEGELHLGAPVGSLAALRAPGRLDELADLPAVLGLYDAAVPRAVGPLGAAGLAATGGTVVDLRTRRARRARSITSPAGWAVASAAACVVALGGLAAASATGIIGTPVPDDVQRAFGVEPSRFPSWAPGSLLTDDGRLDARWRSLGLPLLPALENLLPHRVHPAGPAAGPEATPGPGRPSVVVVAAFQRVPSTPTTPTGNGAPPASPVGSPSPVTPSTPSAPSKPSAPTTGGGTVRTPDKAPPGQVKHATKKADRAAQKAAKAKAKAAKAAAKAKAKAAKAAAKATAKAAKAAAKATAKAAKAAAKAKHHHPKPGHGKGRR